MRKPSQSRRVLVAPARSWMKAKVPRSASSASVMRCEPPRGKGQPTAWPETASISPTAAVSFCSSGRMEWAAQPANRARAWGARNQRSARPHASAVERRCSWANVIVRNHQFGYLPRWDAVWPTMLSIDTDEWSDPGFGEPARDDGTVTVIHAPNHRHVKGTQGLIDAVAELRDEGLDVELELVERRPNPEVLEAMRRADVVAEQFIVGYAMTAIEGMSVGKPVLSALDWMPEEPVPMRPTRCPVKSTFSAGQAAV